MFSKRNEIHVQDDKTMVERVYENASEMQILKLR